jgi:RNA polymerase sigma-70 factor (ECF subfamily)
VNGPTPDVGDLYRRHGAAVLRRVRHFFRDPAESEEVLHEVFERVMDRIGTFAGQSSPVTWLYQVTTRHCINRLRDGNRRRELLDQHGDALGWGAPTSRANQEADALFRDLWKKLDAELVEIGVYYHLDGMTHEEIARVTGVSRRTIGNRLVELESAARALGGEA